MGNKERNALDSGGEMIFYMSKYARTFYRD